MATIEAYQTADGKRYQVRYRTPTRTQTKRRGFKTKRDAEAFAATVEVQKMSGEYVAPAAGRVTVGERGLQWLGRQTHLKPSTPARLGWRGGCMSNRGGGTPVWLMLSIRGFSSGFRT